MVGKSVRFLFVIAPEDGDATVAVVVGVQSYHPNHVSFFRHLTLLLSSSLTIIAI